jgi:hypothetical protein
MLKSNRRCWPEATVTADQENTKRDDTHTQYSRIQHEHEGNSTARLGRHAIKQYSLLTSKDGTLDEDEKWMSLDQTIPREY